MWKNEHPDVPVWNRKFGHLRIDEKIAPLVKACWRHDLDTTFCCQGDPGGMADIGFLPRSFEVFLRSFEHRWRSKFGFWVGDGPAGWRKYSTESEVFNFLARPDVKAREPGYIQVRVEFPREDITVLADILDNLADSN